MDRILALNVRNICRAHINSYMTMWHCIIVAVLFYFTIPQYAIAGFEGASYMKFEAGYGFTSKLKYNYRSGSSDQDDQWDQTWLAAVTKATAATATSITPDRQASGISFGGGIGYIVSKYLRGDITLAYQQMKNVPSKSGSGSNIVYRGQFYQQLQELRCMLNAYLQIPINVDIIPFVGGGVGIAGIRHSVEFVNNNVARTATSGDDGTYATGNIPQTSFNAVFTQLANNTLDPSTDDTSSQGISAYTGKRIFSPAYSVSAGVSYQVSDGMYLDFTYSVQNEKEYVSNNFNAPGFVIQSVVIGTDSAKTPIFNSPEYTSYQNFSLPKYTRNIISLGFRSEF